MYRSRVSSVLESLSSFLFVCSFPRKSLLSRRIERESLIGTVGKKNESSKSSNNERSFSPFFAEFMFCRCRIRGGIQN